MVKQAEREGHLRAAEGLAGRLYEETDGNPFFIGELLRHLGEAEGSDAAVPESVREVLRQRMARLNPAGRVQMLGVRVSSRRLSPSSRSWHSCRR